MEAAPSRVKHSVNPGDLIAAMACMKKFYEITGRKIIPCQATNFEGQYYPGAVHPTVDERGVNVCCNNQMWEMLKPLVESQEYIHSFEKYEGQECQINFDKIRNETFVNLPQGAIQNWLTLAFPDLTFNLGEPWITINGEAPAYITEQIKGKIILNFTERYRNGHIDYFFLRNYAPSLIFSGTEKEHWLFTSKWQLNIPYLKVDNFLDLAYALRDARFILCNQSMCWNLAEAMKVPRIMEICQYAQNCIHGVGKDSFGFLHQGGMEYAFRHLYDKTISPQYA